MSNSVVPLHIENSMGTLREKKEAVASLLEVMREKIARRTYAIEKHEDIVLAVRDMLSRNAEAGGKLNLLGTMKLNRSVTELARALDESLEDAEIVKSRKCLDDAIVDFYNPSQMLMLGS